MSTKKKAPSKKPNPASSTVISNCTVQVGPARIEISERAADALGMAAVAAQRNADAIAEIARALRGAPVTFTGSGIQVGA